MTGSYQNNKTSIYNWNEKNKEKKKVLDAMYSKRHWEWKKVCRVFRLILIDEPV